MRKTHIFYTLFLTSTFFNNSTLSKISLESLYSKLFSKQKQEIIHKELTLEKKGTLSIDNIYGNIQIKTEWSLNSIILKACKRVSKKENTQDIEIDVENQLAANKIAIKTKYKNEKSTGIVDYELIVPNNITVNLNTKKGDIKIKRVQGKIKASSDKGDIKILDAKGSIRAHAQQGNIAISQSVGNIDAKTKYGNISILQSSKSLHATTHTGAIKVDCKKIPSIGSVYLTSNSGNISLSLPSKTNADIKAQTHRGLLTCEHFITLKPQSVLLNKKTWDRFKREVDGTIGTGESVIKISSNSGNIKILKTKDS